jgi:hypothetical protein
MTTSNDQVQEFGERVAKKIFGYLGGGSQQDLDEIAGIIAEELRARGWPNRGLEPVGWGDDYPSDLSQD